MLCLRLYGQVSFYGVLYSIKCPCKTSVTLSAVKFNCVVMFDAEQKGN